MLREIELIVNILEIGVGMCGVFFGLVVVMIVVCKKGSIFFGDFLFFVLMDYNYFFDYLIDMFFVKRIS